MDSVSDSDSEDFRSYLNTSTKNKNKMEPIKAGTNGRITIKAGPNGIRITNFMRESQKKLEKEMEEKVKLIKNKFDV
jgi:hypothetical protein